MRHTPLEVVFKAIDASLELNKLLFTMMGMALSAVIAIGFWFAVSRFGDGRFEYVAAGVALGVLLPWLVVTMFLGALSKLTYECVAFGQHIGWRAALVYAARHIGALFLAPLALVSLVALVILGQAAVLLVGRVSFVGELLASLLFLPFVLVNIFAIITTIFGVWLIFPIIAAEGEGIIGTLVRLAGLVRRAPVKVAGYITLVWMAGVLATVLILLVVSYALTLTTGMSGLGLGLQKTAEILQGVPLAGFVPGVIPIEAFVPQDGATIPLSILAARLIFSAEALILAAGLLAFPVTFLFSSNCAVYLVLRQAEVEQDESRQAFEAA